MAENSKISWTHHTFNPWIGCTKISSGCKFCYAEIFAGRYLGVEWGNNKTRHLTADSTWAKPLSWNRHAIKNNTRYRIFCASLADVFEDNPQLTKWRKRLWETIEKTPQLDWLLLTKRPENYLQFFPKAWHDAFPQNIWIGSTICTQKEYDDQFPFLQKAKDRLKARVSFVSFEPLLEPITLHSGSADWNIIGGESGFLKYARRIDLAWVRSLMNQIRSQGDHKSIFFKQFGSHLAKALRMSDIKGEAGIDQLPAAYDWLKVREVPEGEMQMNKQKILF